MIPMMLKILFILLISISAFSLSAKNLGSETKLKIPRFVSLKSENSNLRIGPSINYPIKLNYVIANIPIEVVDEYKDWRKINDYEGNIGWLHKSLIKGDRFAIVSTPYQESAQVFNKPKGETIGKIGKKNILKINRCLKDWCQIKYDHHKGWVNKLNLWGVYGSEIFHIPFYQPIINQLWKINIIF